MNHTYLYLTIDALKGAAAPGTVQGLLFGPMGVSALQITKFHGFLCCLFSSCGISSLKRRLQDSFQPLEEDIGIFLFRANP